MFRRRRGFVAGTGVKLALPYIFLEQTDSPKLVDRPIAFFNRRVQQGVSAHQDGPDDVDPGVVEQFGLRSRQVVVQVPGRRTLSIKFEERGNGTYMSFTPDALEGR